MWRNIFKVGFSKGGGSIKVKIVLLRKDLYFLCVCIRTIFAISPLFLTELTMNTVISRSFPVQNVGKHSFLTHTYLFHFFSLRPHPPQIQKVGGGILHMPIHFPIGPRPCLSQKGGGACASNAPPPPQINL